MPWFCHSAPKKKRSSKTRVAGVGKVRQDNKSLSGDQPIFAVILQSFASSIGDELTVQRGQVVEVMYHDGDWTFVRNLDAGSGYIPKMYCLSIDKVKGDFNNSMLNHITGPLPRPRVINVDTLQRSGSSVNSVEVHQVTSTTFLENSEPSTRTSSSSQVIYEVPKSPAQRFGGGSASQPTTEVSSEVAPSTTRAPSLPPRSAYLPSPAEIQRQWAPSTSSRPGFLPGSRQSNPFTVAMQVPPPTQQSPVLQRSASYHSTTRQSTGLGHSPSSVTHHRSGTSQATPPSPPTPSSAHRMMTQNSSSQPHPLNTGYRRSAENSPSSVPSSARFSPGTPSSHNPGTSPSFDLGRRSSSQRGVAVGRSHPHLRGQYPQADFSDHVACTPGSAGVPSVAPSPISARVAITPCATKPVKFAATPSGASGVETNSQWPVGGADSTPPSCNQRAQTRRFRRHSSDVVLLESCISEDSNVVTYHSPPQTVARNHHLRQQSQPCVADLSIHSPPRRPTRLPVRRTLSMQDHRKHRQAVAGASRVRSAPIHRAQSYQEAVLSEEERKLGATASLEPSELLEQAATPGKQSCDNQNQSHNIQKQSCDQRHNPDLEPASEPDDVFLPDVNKPFGIYRCTKGYQQKFKGEISLKKNELVIVLDHGKGEWAWVITSSNDEGLIPKSVLVRYHSDLGVGSAMTGSDSLGRGRSRERSDAGTQTEQDTCDAHPDSSDAPSCKDIGVSRKDTGASCSVDSATISAGRETSNPTSSNPHKKEKTNSASTDVKPSNMQSCPKEWFDTLDSVDAAKLVTRISAEQDDVTHPSHNEPGDATISSQNEPATRSVGPAAKGGVAKASMIPKRPKMKKAASVPQSEHNVGRAVGRPKSVISGSRHATQPSLGQGGSAASKIPAWPRLRKASSVQFPGSGASASSGDSNIPTPVTAGTVHYHDCISGLGSVNFESTSSILSPGNPSLPHAAKRPSSLLTAIKDYAPPDNSKNCLPLKQGDILHLQPHMHYPKGWMWVWHTKRRSFGFVPKSYVAYTYDIPKRERRDTIEDAV